MRFIIVLIIALAGHPAWAQVWDPAYRGSGQRAGGPAYLLNYGGYAPGWGYGYRALRGVGDICRRERCARNLPVLRHLGRGLVGRMAHRGLFLHRVGPSGLHRRLSWLC